MINQDKIRRSRNAGEQERVRLDSYNRGRYCPRSHNPVLLLNLGVIATALAIYAANELLFKPSGGGPLLQGYLNDVLAGPLLLAWSNLLIGCGPYRRWEIRTFTRASLLILPAGFYWEFIAPLYVASTSDLRDVLAYWLGACLYILVLTMARRIFHRLKASAALEMDSKSSWELVEAAAPKLEAVPHDTPLHRTAHAAREFQGRWATQEPG